MLELSSCDGDDDDDEGDDDDDGDGDDEDAVDISDALKLIPLFLLSYGPCLDCSNSSLCHVLYVLFPSLILRRITMKMTIISVCCMCLFLFVDVGLNCFKFSAPGLNLSPQFVPTCL